MQLKQHLSSLLENKDSPSPLLEDYDLSWKKSSVWKDLWKVRNVKPSLKWGLILGNMHSGINMWLNDLGLGFLLPYTLKHSNPDHLSLKKAPKILLKLNILNQIIRYLLIEQKEILFF